MNQPTHLKLGQGDRVDPRPNTGPVMAGPQGPNGNIAQGGTQPQQTAPPQQPQPQQQQRPQGQGQQPQRQQPRLDQMFAAFDRSMSKKLQDDGDQTRYMMSDRLTVIENGLSSLDGTIRIDLRPELEAAVTKALDARGLKPRRPFWRAAGLVLLVLTGIGIGALMHAEIANGFAVITALIIESMG